MSNISSSSNRKLQASLGLLILTAVIVGSIAFKPSKPAISLTSTKTTSTAQTSPTVTLPTASTANTSMYKNGTYTATGSYDSPGGEETLGVTLTLNDGIVTAASLKSGSNESTSASYQQDFISGYKRYVIGKPINDIKVGNIAGSSLTQLGFDEALKTIEQQAS